LVLENLGWNIVRVWSTDWWYDKDSATTTLHEHLERLLESSRNAFPEPQEASEQPDAKSLPGTREATEENDVQSDRETVSQDDFEDHEQPAVTIDHPPAPVTNPRQNVRPELVAGYTSKEPSLYQPILLDDSVDRQNEFFDDAYTESIRKMALAVVQAEGPVRDDLVAKRIARAHGFARTGAKIKQRVLETIPELTATKEAAGTFLWPSRTVPDSVPFRQAANQDGRRSLDEIPLAELIGLIQSESHHLENEDPALAFAREIGLARLAKSARERIESAIEIVSANSS
tara:strand:- start:119393 stop:120253 length:861 start_codon:yes stop_codon:yes gene_type:complete